MDTVGFSLALLRLRLSSKVPQPLEAGDWGMLQGIGWGRARATQDGWRLVFILGNAAK